jgi:hypothetical protein
VDSNLHLVLFAPSRDVDADPNKFVGCRGESDEIVSEEQAMAAQQVGIGVDLILFARRHKPRQAGFDALTLSALL